MAEDRPTKKHVQKNLTVMFTDISGFTKHTETITRNELMQRLDTHNELLMPIIAHFDGAIIKTIGDAFLITFESPTNAVQCGLYMQHTLRGFNDGLATDMQIHIKVSINVGEVTATATDVFGDPVNVAAKIEKATKPDEIYFTEAVFLAMNKAEVPNTFVKMFRPKGADSEEIKLYKVIQDEQDAIYQRIIKETKIDPEKLKTRVLELSSVAEKEVARYQDALETLIVQQGRSGKQTIVAILVGAVVLGLLIFGGLTLFGPPASEGGPGDRLSADVHQYLAVGKPGDATELVLNYVQENGADDLTKRLFAEIRSSEINELGVTARRLIESGEPETARRQILDFFRGSKPEGRAAEQLKAAEHYLAARTYMINGESAKVLSELSAAFGETDPSNEVRSLREQARGLVRSREQLDGPDRLEEAISVIGLVSKIFGDNTSNAPALELLHDALRIELFIYAWKNGPEKAMAEHEIYRKRFPQVRGWSDMEREVDLGSIWQVGRRDSRRQYKKDKWWKIVWRAGEYGAKQSDGLFQYRLGLVLYQLARTNSMGVGDGVREWEKALKKDPEIYKRHAEIAALLSPDLVKDYEDPEIQRKLKRVSLSADLLYILNVHDWGTEAARGMIKRMFYSESKDYLVKSLSAVRERDGSPYTYLRASSFAILADMGDAAEVKDPYGFFRDMYPLFVFQSGTTTAAHWQALFELKMPFDDFVALYQLIDGHLQETLQRKGRYGAYTGASKIFQQMIDDLKAAQPEHAARLEE